ncbi:hypothetical protein [Shinella sp. BYT-45]|uniref:hypothetical protein n=1 Tax=Shinella sp. BYT-45 TaxID=3377377 RepID=UPI00397E9E59
MSDDSVKTMWAQFPTRESAERAVERLVQQCGIARANVFVEASAQDNTVGTAPSGGDVVEDGARADAPLHGDIRVSADITDADVLKAEQAFREAGAQNVLVR